jgi:hypothetical protein
MKDATKILLSLFILFITASCSSDDPVVSTPDSSFSMTINDEPFMGEKESEYQVLYMLNEIGEGFDISFLEFSGTAANFRQVRLIIGKYYGGQVEEDDEYFSGNILVTAPNTTLLAHGTYTELDMDNMTHYGVTDTIPGLAYVKVTKLDRANSRISGIFNFIATDEDTNIEYKIENGEFNNLEF